MQWDIANSRGLGQRHRIDSLISSKVRQNQARTLLATVVWGGNYRRHCMYKLPLTSGEPSWKKVLRPRDRRPFRARLRVRGDLAAAPRHHRTPWRMRDNQRRRRDSSLESLLDRNTDQMGRRRRPRRIGKPRPAHLGRTPKEMLMGVSTCVTRVGSLSHGPSDPLIS